MQRFAVLLIAGALLMIAAPSTAQTSEADGHPDSAAVQTWLANYAASWAAADGDRMYRAATDNVEWINIVGMHWRGKAAVVEAHKAFLTTIFRGVPMSLQMVESIRSVGDSAVVVVARWSVGQFTTPTGHIVPPSQDRMTLVFGRTPEGALELVHGANIQIDPAAATSNPVETSN